MVNSNFTAEYGGGMGVIKMATKSGANQFHASAYDRVRNEAFNANTFSNNAKSHRARAVPRERFRRHGRRTRSSRTSCSSSPATN